ncbi:MAG: CHAP domain-containing protein [Aeromicrobium erythreum]
MRRTVLALTGVLVGGLLAAVPAQAAPADCSTLDGCAAAGQDTFGWQDAYRSSFWHQSKGHNCTNYVAFRLTHGRRTARPPGTYSASTWLAAAKKVGATSTSDPSKARPGDVAWWGAKQRGASSSGHVAYVEAVSGTTVTMSEDNALSSGADGFRRWTAAPGHVQFPVQFIRFRSSDGSPVGALSSVSSPKKDQLRVRGAGSDPDTYGQRLTVLASVGGPRSSRTARKVTFAATPYFDFLVMKTDRGLPSGKRWVYVYLRNSAGTPGAAYTYLGRRKLTVR